MLAGGAPLHAERLAVRGGPADAVHDELTFFDVSSYGPRTVDTMLRVVGADRLVGGSDRPVAEPPALPALGPSLAHALTEANPERGPRAARGLKAKRPACGRALRWEGRGESPGLKPRPVTKGICEDWAVPVNSLLSSAVAGAT